MLTQHNRKTARLSPDYTLAIRELGVWSGAETTCTTMVQSSEVIEERMLRHDRTNSAVKMFSS